MDLPPHKRASSTRGLLTGFRDGLVDVQRAEDSLPTTEILDLTTMRVGRSLTVMLCGEFDRSGVRTFREAVGKPECDQRVTIDLRKLTFLDATGMGQLVLLNTRSRRDGFALRIQAPPYPAARIFEITGKDKRLPLE